MNKTVIRRWLLQCILAAVLLGLLALLWQNTATNMHQRHLDIRFSFLDNPAGFAISQHLIPYQEGDSYARVFIVGLLNTLLVSGLAIITATICGTLVGVMRISPNWLVKKLAAVYVEVFRNIPLLLQLFFWYFAVLAVLPPPRQSQLRWACGENGCLAALNNRGLSLVSPQWTTLTQVSVFLLFGAFLLIGFLAWRNKKRQQQTGKRHSWWFIYLALGLLPLLGWFFLASSGDYQLPKLQGFNYQGGITLLPELIALWLALTLYSAAYIAEYVRSGVQSVPRGQYEAATALGLPPRQVMRLIILPQALRVVIPPMTSQYLNIVKNSSLATAIAYPDLVSVFMGTALNQTGRAVEVISMTMAVYLFISLLISFLMNLYNHKIKRTER